MVRLRSADSIRLREAIRRLIVNDAAAGLLDRARDQNQRVHHVVVLIGVIPEHVAQVAPAQCIAIGIRNTRIERHVAIGEIGGFLAHSVATLDRDFDGRRRCISSDDYQLLTGATGPLMRNFACELVERDRAFVLGVDMPSSGHL